MLSPTAKRQGAPTHCAHRLGKRGLKAPLRPPIPDDVERPLTLGNIASDSPERRALFTHPRKVYSAMKSEDKTTIKAPDLRVAQFTIRGTAPYVSNKFSEEARNMMRAKQALGAQAKKGSTKEPKDFDKRYEESMHHFEDGSYGLPASAFRQAMVSACRLIGFKMTLAKLAVFIEPDGFDADPGDQTPLIRFTKGTPEKFESYVRLATGVADISVRGKWAPGWEAVVRVRYDATLFTERDIANLMLRVGCQVGIGAGRPDSKESAGMGWGTFELVE